MPGTVGRGDGERIRAFAASGGRVCRRCAPAVRRCGAIEAPLCCSDLDRGPDGQLPQSPEGQEVAQDGGHQGSEGLPHHFGSSSGGVRRVSAVRIAGSEVSRDLPPHSGSVGPPARQMARQPRYESGRAEAKDPRGRPSKLGRLLGRGRAVPDLQIDAGAHRTLVLW